MLKVFCIVLFVLFEKLGKSVYLGVLLLHILLFIALGFPFLSCDICRILLNAEIFLF